MKAVLTSPAACRLIVRILRERHDAGELDDARWSPVAEELERNRTHDASHASVGRVLINM